MKKRAVVLHGDSLEQLKRLPDNSIHAVVTDPPAGISFMGKEWDDFRRSRKPNDGPEYARGDREVFIESMTLIFQETLRVAKPGAHALVWAIPRTSHWTATALENAGWEIRDIVTHLFGSGFPKSLDVSKAIDKAAGVERTEVIGVKAGHAGFEHRTDAHSAGGRSDGWERPWRDNPDAVAKSHMKFAPATEDAGRWEGWGTALKPAAENWILCRKPLVGTVATNVLCHGTGALNIDSTRVEFSKNEPDSGANFYRNRGQAMPENRHNWFGQGEGVAKGGYSHEGRWPPNTVLSHAEGCSQENDGCADTCAVAELNRLSGTLKSGAMKSGQPRKKSLGKGGYGEGMPDTASTREYSGDSGGASRFFPCFGYYPKASRKDRNSGLGDAKNTHPTVKNTDLMRWLCRLITPPNGIVLDPFCGSGSTGVAALREGFRFVGIEREPEYIDIARKRVAAEKK